MPKMVHPDLGEDRAVDAFPQQVGPYRASGWEVVDDGEQESAGDQPGTDSSAGGENAGGKEKPPPADRPQKSKES